MSNTTLKWAAAGFLIAAGLASVGEQHQYVMGCLMVASGFFVLPPVRRLTPPHKAYIVIPLLVGFSVFAYGVKQREGLPETDTPKAALPKHEVVIRDGGGSFVNLWFFVPSLTRDTAQIKQVATALLNEYCTNEACNQVYFWRDRAAIDLLQYKRRHITLENFDYNKNKWLRAEANWKTKNWLPVCEGLVAAYNNTVQELEFDPYFDSEYRKYGGQKKATNPTTIYLITGAPKLN